MSENGESFVFKIDMESIELPKIAQWHSREGIAEAFAQAADGTGARRQNQ
jgi:hypothetical protein